MDIEVNTKNIEISLKLLNEYIKKYKETIDDLFYEIEKVNSFWVGADKDTFVNIMNNEELNYEELITKIENIKSYFSTAVNKYNDFNNKIDSMLN